MSALLEDFEDMAIACSNCAGEAELLININGELRCIGCLNGKKECA